MLKRPRLIRYGDDLGYLLRALRVRESTITTRLYRARQLLARTLRGKEAGTSDVMVDRGQ